MGRYILGRLLLLVPTALIAAAFIFGLVRLIPGDALLLMMGEQKIAEGQDLSALATKFGFDQPLPVQFLRYMGRVLQGDLGQSFFTGETVNSELAKRLPVTLELSLLAIVLAVVIAVPVGVISAVKQDSPVDYLLRAVTIAGVSVPGFWVATIALLFPALWFSYSPPIFYVSLTDDLGEHLQMMLPPAIILGTHLAASIARMVRSMMLEVLRQDYIRTARAKGLAERLVIYRHGLKNALIPVLTVIGVQINFLLAGTAIMESIYGLPGMGSFVLSAAIHRDYELLQGINLVFVGFTFFLNLIIDTSYGVLDPRIRYS